MNPDMHVQRETQGGLPLYRFSEIDSTNNECRRRLAAGETRCAVLADTQTAGRGRSGKRFYSPAGAGLYLSLMLPAEGGSAGAVGLTTRAAVCTAEAVSALTGKDCGIKWVNDLYWQGKKVCGILTEGAGGAYIVGIGVNLTPAAVPEELWEIMGCLDAPGIRDALAGQLLARLTAAQPGDLSHMEAYRRRSIVLGRTVTFLRGETLCAGTAAAIADDGALAVDTAEGRIWLRSGEISLRGIEGLRADAGCAAGY